MGSATAPVGATAYGFGNSGQGSNLDPVLLFLFPGPPPLVLILSLGLALYLTAIELREMNVHWKWWAWWLSFVFLTHFVGYLILRGYVVFRRWHGARA